MRRGWLPALLVLAAASPAWAALPGDVPDKVRLSIGGISADAFTEGSLSTTGGIGATINFEDVFDLPVTDRTARFAGYWHINKRQYLDFGYVDINRSGGRILDQDITWGDFVAKAGAEVSAGFRSRFPYAAWRYDFIPLEKVRISGSAGITYLEITASLAANGNVFDLNGNPIASGTARDSVLVTFPVPLFGLQVDWAMSKHLSAEVYNRLIYVNLSGIRGGIQESALRIHWYFTKHFGFASGFDKESIDLKEYTSGDTKARFRYEVTGLSAYLDFAF